MASAAGGGGGAAAGADYDPEVEAAKLYEVDLYTRDVLPLLEEALEAQVKKGTYNSRNNLAILKLYQFYPDKLQREYVEHILVKALMNLPTPCFQLCLYMLPQDIQAKPSVSLLIDLERKLSSGQFQEFWKTRSIKEARDLVDRVPGFDDAVRQFIHTALTVTYQSIPVDVLSAAFNVASSDVRTLVTSAGWRLEANVVYFAKNSENQAKPKQVTETWDAADMSKVVTLLASK